MYELKSALAAPSMVHYAGKDREIKPLTFNSLIKIEDKFGDLNQIDMSKARNQRFLVYVILSASDADLTEESVGEMLTFANLEETTEFISASFKLSGLSTGGKDEEVESVGKNVKAAKVKV